MKNASVYKTETTLGTASRRKHFFRNAGCQVLLKNRKNDKIRKYAH